MYAQFYAHMPFASLPLAALLMFLVTFLAVVVRVSRPSQRAELDAAAALPFDQHETHHPIRRESR
jgi:cbb3-type cytochrome oxidase subunit 3